VTALSVSAGKCAAQGTPIPPGTILLAEISHVLTRADIESGRLGRHAKVDNFYEKLKRGGYTDEQINGGRIFATREGIFWNNTASGNKYPILNWVVAPEGLVVEPGNIIELRNGDVSAGVPSWIIRVRAKTASEGRCGYQVAPLNPVVGLLGMLTLVGPRGSAYLYCEGIERDSWTKKENGVIWQKQPAGGETPGIQDHVTPPAIPAQ